jgi:hypothetical protein
MTSHLTLRVLSVTASRQTGHKTHYSLLFSESSSVSLAKQLSLVVGSAARLLFTELSCVSPCSTTLPTNFLPAFSFHFGLVAFFPSFNLPLHRSASSRSRARSHGRHRHKSNNEYFTDFSQRDSRHGFVGSP